jgi:preprotein translocase subunit YajC
MEQGSPGMVQGLIPLIFMFGVFYLIVFRPQMKAQKQQQKMLQDLKKNDAVATSGGLIGTIVNLKPDTVTLRVDDNVRVEVERSAVAKVLKSRSQTEEASR